MFRKVKQTIAGLYALSADRNTKKASENRAKSIKNAAKGRAGKDKYYSDWADSATPLEKEALYSRSDRQQNQARRQGNRAERQTNRANRQYSRADRLMGY